MFTVPRGTADYFANTGRGGVAFYLLSGDLCQMGTMESALRSAGHPVCRSESGTYPGFVTEDQYKAGLTFLYNRRVEGWWNQRTDLVKYGVCTEAEYIVALDEEVKRGR